MSSETCLRPAFHFAPPSGWLNDPNGLVYHAGQWHLFYQWDPNLDRTSEGMWWGHAVSPDLVHWQHLPPALRPDELGAIWSGSIVEDAANTSGLFGPAGGLVAAFTHHGSDRAERQSLAGSADHGLTWTKYQHNPVLGDGSCRDFRDPKVFWHAPTGRWIMIVGVRHQLFASSNLTQWTRLGETGFASECPDLFPLQVEGEGRTFWCLSLAGRHCVLGDFDGAAFTPRTDPLAVDGGLDFYAALSWDNVPGGRRVWIGWLNDWKYATRVPNFGALGFMSVPRDLSLRRINGTLRLIQRPSPELLALRQDGATLDPSSAGGAAVPGGAMEIVATFDPAAGDPCGLRLRTSRNEETLVGYDDATGCAFVDRERSGRSVTRGRHSAPLPRSHGPVRLRLFLDHTCVEAFFNDGEAVISSQIYPESPISSAAWFTATGASALADATAYPLA